MYSCGFRTGIGLADRNVIVGLLVIDRENVLSVTLAMMWDEKDEDPNVEISTYMLSRATVTLSFLVQFKLAL
jgi:hypothetical protein